MRRGPAPDTHAEVAFHEFLEEPPHESYRELQEPTSKWKDPCFPDVLFVGGVFEERFSRYAKDGSVRSEEGKTVGKKNE